MKRPPLVSVIILNWNGWRDTTECLESLKNISYSNYEVIVVDNGSLKENRRKLITQISRLKTKTKKLKLKTIFSSKNLGFAGGNNVVIEQILKKRKSDYVLLLNNDTLVDKDFLGVLVTTAEKEKSIAMVGPKIYYWANDGPTDRVQSFGRKWNFYFGKASSIDNFNKVDFVIGAVLLIKVEVIRQIGLMDERFFLNFEDNDWCFRAKKEGFTIIYQPEAIVWHKTSRSINRIPNQWIYFSTRNLIWLEFKHAKKLQLLCFLVCYFLFVFPMYFFGYLLIKKNKDLFVKYIRGVWDGLMNYSSLSKGIR